MMGMRAQTNDMRADMSRAEMWVEQAMMVLALVLCITAGVGMEFAC